MSARYNRLPNLFIQHRKTGESIFTEQIKRLACGLGQDWPCQPQLAPRFSGSHQDGALVISQGANRTAHRWRRGIRRIDQKGRPDLAARARGVPNLLSPRPRRGDGGDQGLPRG